MAGIVGTASAGIYPLPGAATNITYDSFDTTVTGCTGGGQYIQIWYGLSAGSYPKHVQVNADDTTWLVHVDVDSGYEGKKIYYDAVDETLGVGSARFDTLISYPPTLIASAATGATSNSFNVSVNGPAVSEVWVLFGSQSGIHNWQSEVYDMSATNTTVVVQGSPLYGGETVYYKACTAAGCTAQSSVTLLSVTTVPTLEAKRIMQNITRSRFNLNTIQVSLVQTLSQSAPFIVMIGWALLFFGIGMWYRNRGIALLSIMIVILAPFVMYANQGLYLGVPTVGQAIVAGVMAAGLTAILIRLMQK